jgi:acyl-CoA thioester hydrolase
MAIPFHTPLTDDEQRAFGMTDPAPLAMADQVRFSELDALDHVNNSVYMQWFERLRVRYMQTRGISDYKAKGDNPRVVIRSGSIHYQAEMRMDDIYAVTCGCSSFRTTSFSLHQEVWSSGTRRATFDCVMVLLKPDGSGQRHPLPDDVRSRLIQTDGAIAEDPR